MARILGLLIALGIIGCPSDSCESTPTFPSPPPLVGDEDLLPARNDTEPSFYDVLGFSGFALAQYPEDHIRAFVENGLRHDYNTVRVCSETGHWDRYSMGFGLGPYVKWLPPGPRAGTEAARQDVKKLLAVTAEYPNFWIELISSCTIKHLSFEQQNEWAGQVARLAKPWKHVFLNAVNEPQESSLSASEVLGLIRTLKTSKRPVGVDSGVGAGSWRFPIDWARECDWIGVHPRRNPDLSLEEIRNVISLNGPGPVLFNETTCFITDDEIEQFGFKMPNSLFYNEGLGSEEERRKSAIRYMNLFKKVSRARWYFHSLAGLHCQRTDFWMPHWRDES